MVRSLVTGFFLLGTATPALAQETGTAVAEDGVTEVTGAQGGIEISAGAVALGIAALAALGLALTIAADSPTSSTTTSSTTTTTTTTGN